MCGRFTRSSPPAVIAEELGVEIDPATVAGPRFNVCPSEEVLVVARGDTAPRAGWMRWGLVPWFASDAKSGPRSINARAETVATYRVFRDAFERRRCLVVVDGFYEWQRVGNERNPFFFRLRSRRPFVLAGVWDRWKGEDGQALLSCAIVTCPANGLMAPIHDRMPVIVPAAGREPWLASATAAPDLAPLLRPYPEDELEVYPVSRFVNAPRNDGPECIRRLEAPAES